MSKDLDRRTIERLNANGWEGLPEAQIRRSYTYAWTRFGIALEDLWRSIAKAFRR